MRILTCHNFTLARSLAHFETFSTVLAFAFPGAVDQFSRTPLSQVSDSAVPGPDPGLTGDTVMTAPSRAAVEAGRRMRLQRAEISAHCNPTRSCLLPEGCG